MSGTGAPGGRLDHTAVWTGTRMIIWGGRSGSTGYADGFSYNPLSNSWTTISNGSAPGARWGHSAVWTGTRMEVWGGSIVGAVFSNGAGYNPVLDSWTTISATGEPGGRAIHAAGFDGTRMIVWGGIVVPGSTTVNTGGRYTVGTANWQSTSTTGAPTSRWYHTGVWTGNSFVVWGGSTMGATVPTDTGGQYNTLADTWTAMPLSNAPSPRVQHTAVWTGSRMIVWGGTNGTTATSSGGLFDPTSNLWTGPGSGGGVAAGVAEATKAVPLTNAAHLGFSFRCYCPLGIWCVALARCTSRGPCRGMERGRPSSLPLFMRPVCTGSQFNFGLMPYPPR